MGLMPTKHLDFFTSLSAPFGPNEVKVKSHSGRQMPYVTARTVMNRLDNVCGPENWWDDYIPSENSVVCILSIRLPDQQVLTKQDAGGYPDMKGPSADEDSEKGGFSDAFKRAAVKFGVARYLYHDGVSRLTDASEGHEVSGQPEQATEGSRNTCSENQAPQAPKEVPSPVGARSEYSGIDPEDMTFWGSEAPSFWTYLNDAIEHCNEWYRQTFPERIEDLPGRQTHAIADHAELVPHLILKTAEKNLHQKDPRARKNQGVPIGAQVQTLTEVYQRGPRESLYMRRVIQDWLKKRASERMYSNAPTRAH
jgi:hypothetical protein